MISAGYQEYVNSIIIDFGYIPISPIAWSLGYKKEANTNSVASLSVT